MKERMRGFTLLEMMVVVAIGAILLLIAVPSFNDFIGNARMTSAANDFIAASHFARSEAIKRRQPVTVRTCADPLAAGPACPDSAALTGWIVFVDDNADGALDTAEQVLQQHAPIPASITARSTLNPMAITYLGSGFSRNQVSAQIVLCDKRGNRLAGGEPSSARGIVIAPTGRTSVSRDRAEIDAMVTAVKTAVGGGAIGGCS